MCHTSTNIEIGCDCFLITSTKVKDSEKKRKSNKITIPHKNDVLLGRGGNNNKHTGNENLRNLARERAYQYSRSTKKGKSELSRKLVKHVRDLDPPGRFLKISSDQSGTYGEWLDVGDIAAREKTSQVLRDAVGCLENHNPCMAVNRNSPPSNTKERRTKRSRSNPKRSCKSSRRKESSPDAATHPTLSKLKRKYVTPLKPVDTVHRNVQGNHHKDKKARPSEDFVRKSRRSEVQPNRHNQQMPPLHPALRYASPSHRGKFSERVDPPQDSETWSRTGVYSHNYPFPNVNVHAFNAHGRVHSPNRFPYAHNNSQHSDVQTTVTPHSNGFDDWNFDLDTDDISWISESNQPHHNATKTDMSARSYKLSSCL